jgi:hypothetical protein
VKQSQNQPAERRRGGGEVDEPKRPMKRVVSIGILATLGVLTFLLISATPVVLGGNPNELKGA